MIVVGTATKSQHLPEVLKSWARAAEEVVTSFNWWVEPSDQSTHDLIRGWDLTVTYVLNEQVLGPLENPFQALDWGFKNDEFVVLVEDDAIVAPDTLRWFDWCRRTFRDDLEVGAVCSYQLGPGEDPCVTRKEEMFRPTVWGTWKDRWDGWMRETWDHDYSSGPEPTTGWDWNLRERVLPERGMVTVIPEVSRSDHVGEHGAHCTPEMFESTQSKSFTGRMHDGPYRLES